ncbi:MAG: alpha/beta fold hydrolase [Oceanococcaceae bacterium]
MTDTLPTTRTVAANGIEICYEDRPGPQPDSPVLLLVHGLGCQLLHWPEDLLIALNAQFRVIRYDNRDTGHSTWFKGIKAPPMSGWGRLRWFLGARAPAPYTLEDMAADAIGLLDALGIDRAHVMGASMGGMIAQILGLDYPQRVQSLTLVMTTSGRRTKGLPRPEVLKAITQRPQSMDFDIVLAASIRSWKTLSGRGHVTPDDEIERRLRAILTRAQNPAGFLRHYAAIMNQPDRTVRLRQLRLPTLVLHGEDDGLVGVSGGRQLAAVIPGATLKTVPGWGHDFPPSLTATLTQWIAQHVQAAQESPHAAVADAA